MHIIDILVDGSQLYYQSSEDSLIAKSKNKNGKR